MQWNNKIFSRKMRVITNLRLGRLTFALIAAILVLFVLSHYFFSSATTHLFNGVSHKFHHWFQKTVFDHNWEDIHCRRRFKNETHVDESWVIVISDQLNIKGSHAVFDSNTGCNEWLRSLRKKYPKLVIGGAHKDFYAVEYAKRVFNDTPGTFYTLSTEDKGLLLSQVPSHMYDHAINYAGLRELPKDIQCSLVRELLRIVKPGGSIYIGHNMEETDCKVLEKYSGYVTLPGCYWTKCLENRTDIADMYYIREDDLYGHHADIDSCYTAVFIHKKVIFNRVKDGPVNIKAKYKEHSKKYYCKPKPQDGIFDWAKQGLLSLHAGGHPRDIASSLRKFRNGKKSKNSSTHIEHTSS